VLYPLEFAWWTKQAACTPAQFAALQAHAQAAPAETASRLSLALDEAGNVRSHQMHVLVARFDKE
jgi:hypothetical protein